MASEAEKLKFEFQIFKENVIGILEEVVDYLYVKDVLGPERERTERMKKLINSLKKGG